MNAAQIRAANRQDRVLAEFAALSDIPMMRAWDRGILPFHVRFFRGVDGTCNDLTATRVSRDLRELERQGALEDARAGRSGQKRYRLTDKGRARAAAMNQERRR